MARRVEHAIVETLRPDAGQPEEILLRLLVKNVHGVIDRDHPDQSTMSTDHRGRNEMVLVERVGDLLLRHRGRNRVAILIDDVEEAGLAP